jgi:hypothetical protein
MSLFVGNTGTGGLRLRYKELVAGDLAAAASPATAKLLETMRAAGRLCYIDNSTDKDLILVLVHPEADPMVTANRFDALEIPTDRVLNFAELFPNLAFDPGTFIYLYSKTGAPASGKVRIVTWG